MPSWSPSRLLAVDGSRAVWRRRFACTQSAMVLKMFGQRRGPADHHRRRRRRRWRHGRCATISRPRRDRADATVMDEAGRRCGAEIIAIDRPGIGRSDLWSMVSVGPWGPTVAQVADILHLDDFAVAGWSGGGPHALACAAAAPGRVRAVAIIDGVGPFERLKNVFEIGFFPTSCSFRPHAGPPGSQRRCCI
jgi:pimeloyl-ACP methyl ester carboxylesterase